MSFRIRPSSQFSPQVPVEPEDPNMGQYSTQSSNTKGSTSNTVPIPPRTPRNHGNAIRVTETASEDFY